MYLYTNKYIYKYSRFLVNWNHFDATEDDDDDNSQWSLDRYTSTLWNTHMSLWSVEWIWVYFSDWSQILSDGFIDGIE